MFIVFSLGNLCGISRWVERVARFAPTNGQYAAVGPACVDPAAPGWTPWLWLTAE